MMAREWLQQSTLAVGDAVAALERLDMLRARNGEHSTPKDRRINERTAIALRAMHEARDLLDEQLHRGMRP